MFAESALMISNGCRAVNNELPTRLGPVFSAGASECRPSEAVFDALDAEGVPREWVLGVDEEKLDVVLAVTDVEESAVYDTTEQVYIQKTGVEESEKQSRLQGLKDRLAELEDAEAESLHEEIEGLEQRIDEVLASA
ncbi:MAG: hypothetical protein ACI8UR_000211 [Natronomonas sp.]|jgi:hypothetical protein